MKWRRLLLFAACALAALPARAQVQVAFTWDDLPAHCTLPPGVTRQQVIDSLIGTIQAEHMPAPYGFVNAKWIEGQPDLIKVLDAWRAAGFPLGNHRWSHLNLDAPTTTLDAWEKEVLQDEPVLRQEMGPGDFRWLRYPSPAVDASHVGAFCKRVYTFGRSTAKAERPVHSPATDLCRR